MIYAVDFDGCLCRNAYPNIGDPNMSLIRDLIKSRNRGDRVILWTCREGKLLDEAVQWCANHGLMFDAVNENLPMNIRAFGSDTRKIYADLYLDDKACKVSYRMSARTGRGKRKVE